MQQQADGLLAQATRMEDDAQKLLAEANQLQFAADGARASATAKAAAVEQVISGMCWIYASGAMTAAAICSTWFKTLL